jgi:hypothetical protein
MTDDDQVVPHAARVLVVPTIRGEPTSSECCMNTEVGTQRPDTVVSAFLLRIDGLG